MTSSREFCGNGHDLRLPEALKPSGKCRQCQRAADARHRGLHLEARRSKDRALAAKRRTEQPEKVKEAARRQRERHPDRIKEYRETEGGREAYLRAQRRYAASPKGKTTQERYATSQKAQDVRKEYRASPEGRIANALRCRVRSALKGTSKAASTMALVGCSREELMVYLEAQWQPGMNWDNYGFRGWHVDHRRPCASFNMQDPAQQAECFHYTNLQPLWAIDNLRKHASYSPDGN